MNKTILATLILFLLILTIFPIPSRANNPKPIDLKVLQTWLNQQNIPTVNLQERLIRLKKLSIAATGNLLIITLPSIFDYHENEINALKKWLIQGNSLLIQTKTKDISTLLSLYPNNHTNTATNYLSKEPFSNYYLATLSNNILLNLFWQPLGDGQLWQITSHELFTNQQINKADNAKLFIALLNHSLSKAGTVILDDFHLGQPTFYDPALFYADTRLHKSLALIVILWLVFIVGSAKYLGPRICAKKSENIKDFIDSASDFLARTVSSQQIANQLTQLEKESRVNYAGQCQSDNHQESHL